MGRARTLVQGHFVCACRREENVRVVLKEGQAAQMHEETLRDFFTGTATAQQLVDDLKGSLVQRGHVTKHCIVDMSEDFHVAAHHLLRLCDAVLAGQVEPQSLQAIGFCLQASGSFFWDSDEPGGERVSETTADWSAPRINHALTHDNVRRWRHYLETGEYTLGTSTG
jgi:hypothetical protein